MFPGRTLESLAGDLESFLSFLKAFLSIIGRPFTGKCWNPQRVMSHEIKVMPEENCRFIYFVPHGKPPKIQSLVVLPRFPSVEALCILATFLCIMHNLSPPPFSFCSLLLPLVPQLYQYFWICFQDFTSLLPSFPSTSSFFSRHFYDSTFWDSCLSKAHLLFA